MANKLSLNKAKLYMIFRKNNANTCVNNCKIQVGNETIQKEFTHNILRHVY